MLQVYQVLFVVFFFNATHQVKAIAIGVSEANPLGESSIVPLLFTLHVFLPLKSAYNLKELTPDTHFYMALYSSFSDFMGITFTRPVFCSKLTMTMVLQRAY